MLPVPLCWLPYRIVGGVSLAVSCQTIYTLAVSTCNRNALCEVSPRVLLSPTLNTTSSLLCGELEPQIAGVTDSQQGQCVGREVRQREQGVQAP
jgi:hypothetical protein